ncbi:MAG: DUF58 domain-containing protein [Gammaproteobacteria bacterium]|nr:DUF58 domain-containing protein [Gammaproteobacteria bacterium]
MQELPLIPGFLARYIERWAVKRLPDTDYQATIVRQRLYILPTRQGLLFTTVLGTILLGAINYENSLTYMLCFLFASIGFLGMIYTHQNLNHLRLGAASAKAVFAGQAAQFPLSISSVKQHSHYNIRIQCKATDAICAHLEDTETESLLMLPVTTKRRGYIQLGRIKIYTEFPFGLFHAWCWVELNAQAVVYPEPDAHPPQYTHGGRQHGHQMTQQEGYDDFAGIRKYRKGDAPNHLAWKAIARTGDLQTKQFYAEAADEIWLDWHQLADDMDVEKRLSVLCRWILDADKQGIKFGLIIPGKNISPGTGRQHRHVCLKALALFGIEA